MANKSDQRQGNAVTANLSRAQRTLRFVRSLAALGIEEGSLKALLVLQQVGNRQGSSGEPRLSGRIGQPRLQFLTEYTRAALVCRTLWTGFMTKLSGLFSKHPCIYICEVTRSMKYLVSIFVLLFCGLLGSASIAQELKISTEMTWGHIFDVDTPYHKCALWAAKQIALHTNNRISVEVYPRSSLGFLPDLFKGMKYGNVDIVYADAAFAAKSYEPISISTAPYMFRDFQHWEAYRDSDLFEDVSGGYFETTGKRVVAMTYSGERQFTTNRPIKSLEDLKGLKIAISNAPLSDVLVRATGAKPTPVASSNVYNALLKGVIDAQESSLPIIEGAKYYQVQNSVALTGHGIDSLLTIAGGPVWVSIDKKDRTVIVDILKESATRCTQDVKELETAIVKALREFGVKFVTVDRTEFRKAYTAAFRNVKNLPWSEELYKELQNLAE